MRVRRLVWRTAGSAAGSRAPRAVAAYYDAVVRSLTRALLRIDGVESVYAAGSYAGGGFAAGRSDVDLVAAIDAPSPEEHHRILLAARTAYRRHQAVLPIDLTLLEAVDFPRAAATHALFRRRIAAPVARHPVEGWRLLAGPDLRGPLADPLDGRLVRLTDGPVIAAAAALARGDEPGVAKALWPLAKDAEAEGLDAAALRDPSGERALAAAYAMVVAVRERDALPLTDDPPPDLAEWRAEAPTAAAAVPASRALLSATLYAEPFTGRPTLLLEADGPEEAAALARSVGGGSARAAALALEGVEVAILPTALAEDPWPSTLRPVAILAGGVHLAGEPLAPRIRFGPPEMRRAAARVATEVQWWRVAPVILGRRFIARDDTLVLRLAAHALLARGGPALLDPHALAAATRPELENLAALDRDTLGLLALELRAQTSATPPARIRSGSTSL